MTTTILTADQAATHAFADTNIPAGSGTINYQVSATFNGVMSEQESSNFVSVSRTPAPIQVGIGNTVEEDLNLGGAAQPGDIVYVSVGNGFTVTSVNPPNIIAGGGPFNGMTQITVDGNGSADVLVTGGAGAAGGTLTVYNSSGQPLAIVPQEAVTISDPSVTLPINTTTTLDLTVTGSFLTIDPITFSCSLVTVSVTSYQMIPGGGEIVHALVTAGSDSGIAPITATDSEGAWTTGLATVTVPVPIYPDIHAFGTNVAVGDTTQMDIYVTNDYGGLPLANESINIVLSNGNATAQPTTATTNIDGIASFTITGVNPGGTGVTATDQTHAASGVGGISVYAVTLQSLTANTATANAGGSANLDVVADANGNTTINLSAMYMPSDAGKLIPWTISGIDATPNHGTFENPPPLITISGITVAASFTIEAGTSATGVADIQCDAKPGPLTIAITSKTYTIGVDDAIKVTVKDGAGNPVKDDLTVTSDDKDVSGDLQNSIAVDGDGEVLISPKGVGTFKLTLKDAAGNTISPDVTVAHQTIKIISNEFKPITFPGQEAHVVAELDDANGKPIAGQSLEGPSNYPTLILPTGNVDTNNNGQGTLDFLCVASGNSLQGARNFGRSFVSNIHSFRDPAATVNVSTIVDPIKLILAPNNLAMTLNGLNSTQSILVSAVDAVDGMAPVAGVNINLTFADDTIVDNENLVLPQGQGFGSGIGLMKTVADGTLLVTFRSKKVGGTGITVSCEGDDDAVAGHIDVANN